MQSNGWVGEINGIAMPFSHRVCDCLSGVRVTTLYSPMNTEPTVRDGELGELIGELESRRVINCDGTLIQRLLIEPDGDDEVAVLTTPEFEPTAELQADVRYAFTDVVYCGTSMEPTTEECPACGGPLRRGMALDTFNPNLQTAIGRLDVDAIVAVASDQTRVTEAECGSRGADDWRPMHPGAHREHEAPDFVCLDCHRSYQAHQLRATDSESPHDELLDSTSMASAAPAPESSLGMATGGAADVTNFRENIRNGYTPLSSSMATEGLFYDYYFETSGEAPDTDALFAPQYASAVSDHPLTGETERYIAVGLDSNLSVEAFERPQLDIVAVLDVSGSMDSQFDQYYYDEHGRRRETDAGDETKLEAAIESLCALTEQLEADDRLGVVLYNNRSHVAKPLRDVETTDMPAIRQHIRSISAGGGTNLSDGFEAGWELLADAPTRDCEQRLVFLTDMMPNTGATDENELTTLFADAASDGIHTTFIGMGLDENADLASSLSGIRGANHYFVTSGEEFRQRLGDEFEYMVTPLVYDLALELDTEGYEIADVYGSPSPDSATGRLLHVGTLFPSPKHDGETRGGLILVGLTQTEASPDSELVASWTELDGEEREQRIRIDVPDTPESFAHDGVRKAIALSRYARELQTWSESVHAGANRSTAVDDWLLDDGRNDHERESVPLVVSDGVASRLSRLRNYLTEEMAVLGDDTLQQELDLLELLCSTAASKHTEVTE
jgi:Ca-activated chloride channel family protein